MRTTLKKAMTAWLSAEARGRDDGSRAEAALAEVFLRLPLPAPGPEFVARTLARCGLAPRRRDLAGWARAVVAAGLTVAAIVAILAPGTLVALARAGLASKGSEVVVELLAGLPQRLAHALALWDVLGRLGSELARASLNPATFSATVVVLVLSVAGFRWLDQVLAVERRSTHA